MYSFQNDYSEGCHPNILKALESSNLNQTQGYGLDIYSSQAKDLIKEYLGCMDADIHFISGGTQTNLLAISAFLRPHQAVIACQTGHIATYETGAIEATGHKVVTGPGKDGKLTIEIIDGLVKDHHFEHMVKPKMVYISNPTEYGTLYSLSELKALRNYCDQNNLYLYCDGARLGMAIEAGDADLKDHYELTDVFFIGATKVGALLGEALVIRNQNLKEELRYLTKQRGALLAKGRVLGLQFQTLFTDHLYFKLAGYANAMAQKLADGLKNEGCRFLIESKTNQIFPIMDHEKIEQLNEDFLFYTWEQVDENQSAIRLITSWATPESAVEAFLEAYKTL